MESNPLANKGKERTMSMDNDTRLMMMNMRTDARRPVSTSTRKSGRRPSHALSIVGLATFALTLFTRGA